jgi:hypothetical protein
MQFWYRQWMMHMMVKRLNTTACAVSCTKAAAQELPALEFAAASLQALLAMQTGWHGMFWFQA